MLNRNPKNYFAEIEQIAFSPAHMVPGIEPSPDKMLQVCMSLDWHDPFNVNRDGAHKGGLVSESSIPPGDYDILFNIIS